MDKEHLHNKVVREIIAMISSGEYGDGQRLPAERSLCEGFSVSRGTLRKALGVLSEMGVVDIRHGSGVYVCSTKTAELPKTYLPADFKSVDLDDIIEARKVIEIAAGERACGNLPACQLAELRKLVDDMSQAVDSMTDFLELDLAFHQAVVRAGGNAVLTAAFEAIYDYHRFSSIYTSQAEGEEELALKFHSRLVDALENGTRRQVRGILTEHLDSMKKYSPQRSRSGRKARAAAGA